MHKIIENNALFDFQNDFVAGPLGSILIATFSIRFCVWVGAGSGFLRTGCYVLRRDNSGGIGHIRFVCWLVTCTYYYEIFIDFCDLLKYLFVAMCETLTKIALLFMIELFSILVVWNRE